MTDFTLKALKRILNPALIIIMTAVSVALYARSARPGVILEQARNALSVSDHRRAVMLADSVLTLSRNALTRIEALDVLAHAHRALGNFDRCIQAYDQAEEIFTTSAALADYTDPASADGLNFANLMLNRAQSELALGRYDECSATLWQTNFPEGHEGYLRKLGVMATLAYREGEPEKAIGLLDTAIRDAKDSPTLAMLIQNRGFIKAELKRYGEAYEDLRRAADMTEGKEKAIALSNSALALAGMQRYDESLDLIDKALQMLERNCGNKDADYIIALRKKGEILHLAGKEKEASEIMHRFFGLERARLSEVLPTMPAQMRLDYWTKEKPLLSKCFILGDSDAGFLFDVALMRRETSLPQLRGHDNSRLSATRNDVRKLLRPGEAAVAFVVCPDKSGDYNYAAITLPYKGKPRFVTLFKEDYVTAPETVGDLSIAEAIAIEDSRYKNIMYRDSALAERIWRPVINALPHDIRSIHFAPEGVFHLIGIENLPFEGRERLEITRHFSLLDLSGKEIDTEGRALVAGGLDYDGEPAAHSANSDPNNMAYAELRRNIGERKDNRIFSYLPGTATEARLVAEAMPGATLTDTLSEEDFKTEAPRQKILHIATHGYSLDCGVGKAETLPGDTLAVDLSLLRSGLALSGANILGEKDMRDDGIISAREICDLDLSDTDLVVLSACQTARGYITDENASGLIRALKIAGARTIVASLWEVDDKATSLFMSEFHRRLSSGEKSAEAFAGARRHVAGLTQTRHLRKFDAAAMASRPTAGTIETAPYADPWYWAPFILIDP